MWLEGDLPSNLERLREFCSARRFLVIVDGAHDPAPHELIFGGRCSTLMVSEEGPEASTDPLRPIQLAFTAADSELEWAELCALARQGRRLARDQCRIAECYELMQQWHALAQQEGDRAGA